MTLVTYTGKIFDYKNITKESIDVKDIINSIVKINRFVGHSSRAYSVGEHTLYGLLMAKKLGYSPLAILHWFIHDFTEAYVGDCPTPLKRLLPDYIAIEAQVESAILEYLGLEPLTTDEFKSVKRIDMTMLVIEMRDLTLHNHETYMGEDLVYGEMLEDNDFTIPHYIDTDRLQQTLLELFEQVREEVING
jgi:hypothetical protein